MVRTDRARNKAKALRTAGPISAAAQLEELGRLPAILVRWKERCAGTGTSDCLCCRANCPTVPSEGGGRPAAAGAGISISWRLDTLELSALAAWLVTLADDRGTPFQRFRCCQLETVLRTNEAACLIPHLSNPQFDSANWPELFQHAWLSSCMEAIHIKEPGLAGFNGRTHEQFVREFRELDEERTRAAVGRVRRACAEKAIETRNRHSDQDAVVSREAQKKSRHLPLRSLFAQAPDVLLALNPCWMASPLSVSQLLPADRPYFDVVLFDEASQVLPEDAVAALLRGRQAVVAGDKHQLPPTTFFAAGGGDDESSEEAGATEGFESILDLMSAFLEPPWSLDWHYRSRDESLIAFSNHHIYDDRLVTFPGPGGGSAISHVLVKGSGREGEEQSCSAEVSRVVELVLRHAEQRPSESLGVITMGIKHAQRIEAALDQARESRPELDNFFNQEARNASS